MRNKDAISLQDAAENHLEKMKPTSQDQHQKEMQAFANEWMNNGCQESDQDIT